jgi:ABC-type transport system substrate-binding protein
MNDPRSFFIGYNHDNRYINGSFTPLGINDPTQAEAAGIKVRKAISAAIPRDLIEEFYSGNVGLSKSFLPEVNSEWEANLTVRAYDIDKAILLMESAGYDYSTDVDLSHEVNENNSLFTLYLISLDTGGPGWYYTQAHLLEQELPKIGINVVHQLLGWNFYDFTLFSPDRPSVGAISEEGDLLGWDLLSYSHLFDFDYDIRNILDSSSLRPNGDNFYNYENTEWDNLVEEYSSLSNLSLRKEKTYELKLFLNENEPITPTFTLQDNYIVFNTVSNYDNVLLSINALEWEKLTIATLSKGDEAGMGFISAIIGVALLPIIKKKVNWRN